MLDGFGRNIDYLRLSVTDRCDLRCRYCMPEGGVPVLGHGEILRFEEILRLTELLAELGVRHLRVTGGEPMARWGCLELLRSLRGVPGIESLSMTSNGQLLAGRVAEAKAAGLEALNLSLDSPDPEEYAAITRGGDVERVMRTLEEALDAGLRVKLNAVPVRGINEEGLVDLALLARDRPIQVRFIELMPLGCAGNLEPVPQEELMDRLSRELGPMIPDREPHGHGPARYLRPEGFRGSLGFISPLSHGFCGSCNRIRLTAEGQLKLCLNHSGGLDLRALLRSGAGDGELRKAIREAVAQKPERHGFGERLLDRERRAMNEIGG